MNVLPARCLADAGLMASPPPQATGPSSATAACVPVERLYDAGRTKLQPMLARKLGSRADAEDVLHEAFARFLARYAGRSLLNPLAMLAQIALNIVRDTARSEKIRRNLLATQNGQVCWLEPALDPEAELSLKQEARLLRAAIDALPVRCREVFLLHCVDEQPHAEVARLLGISRSMVEKHVMGAYRRLRAELERAGWGGADADMRGHGGLDLT